MMGRSMARTAAMCSPPEAAPTRAVSLEQSRYLQFVKSERAGASDSESQGECGLPQVEHVDLAW